MKNRDQAPLPARRSNPLIILAVAFAVGGFFMPVRTGAAGTLTIDKTSAGNVCDIKIADAFNYNWQNNWNTEYYIFSSSGGRLLTGLYPPSGFPSLPQSLCNFRRVDAELLGNLIPGDYIMLEANNADSATHADCVWYNLSACQGHETGHVNFTLGAAGNTPAGSNVMVGPVDGVTITFSQVISGGETAVTASTIETNLPGGFKFGNPPVYYHFSTTAIFAPPVTTCFSFNPAQFKDSSNLKLLHSENGSLADVTTSLDLANNTICGQVSSFSEFAIVENLTLNYLSAEVANFNLKNGLGLALLDKLAAAKNALDKGQNKTAANMLRAFINLVKAQKGKGITDEQAGALNTDAQTLIGQW